MRVVGYAYPWDYLGDPSAPTRAASLGLDGVVLAASYHACRAASPLHPTRRALEVPHSACYVPVREEPWRGQRLKPRSPTWLEDEDSFARAARALGDVGVTSEAWIVLNHVDGVDAPVDCLARNAFGDAYTYALCPSADEVRTYGRTLVEEIVLAAGTRGVVLEALGPMGFAHQGVHEKTDLARYGDTTTRLLSLCFCGHCRRGYLETGVDADELAARVREGISNESNSVDEALGHEFADAVSTYRAMISRTYLDEILTALGHPMKLTLHASARPWTTGSFCWLPERTALEGVTTVANCWDLTTASTEVAELRALVGPAGRVGGYLRLEHDAEPDADATFASLRAAGVDELHLYHLGLTDQGGLDVAREYVRAAHAAPERAP